MPVDANLRRATRQSPRTSIVSKYEDNTCKAILENTKYADRHLFHSLWAPTRLYCFFAEKSDMFVLPQIQAITALSLNANIRVSNKEMEKMKEYSCVSFGPT